MNFYKIWKNHLSEEKEWNYHTECDVVYDSKVRNQTYVLNDVREILGVRIVTVTDPVEVHGGLEMVKVMLKYDPPPGQPLVSFMPYLKRNMLRINGITKVKMGRTQKVEI